MFQWVTNNAELSIITLNANNITLNQNASTHFRNSQYAMVGFSEHQEVAIKPVTAREMDLAIYPKENLHKLSIGKSYVKISNKSLCDLIASRIGKQLSGQKVSASFNEKDEVLVFDLKPLMSSEEGIK